VLILAFFSEGLQFRQRFIRWRYGVSPGVKLETVELEGYLEKEVKALVEEMAAALNKPPRNAYFDKETGQIIPEKNGQRVNVSATIKRIMEAPPGTALSLVTVSIDPEFTASFFSSFDRVVGQYHTWIGGGTRSKNIVLAARSINNTLLSPGEIFSFNAVVGPRTLEKGYEFAPIISGGRIIPGIGGGICQVSSTLYNAVLDGELEVIERYPHSKPVYYVPPGRDATVTDYLDFRFRNSSSSYLMVKSSTVGGKIEITILTNSEE
jgi:vancomycin resistance protein YoaR